jgi:hypothetical protein
MARLDGLPIATKAWSPVSDLADPAAEPEGITPESYD